MVLRRRKGDRSKFPMYHIHTPFAKDLRKKLLCYWKQKCDEQMTKMSKLRFVIGPIAFVIFALLVSHFGFYLSFYTPRGGIYPYKDLGTILIGTGIVMGIVGSILLVVMLMRKYAYTPSKNQQTKFERKLRKNWKRLATKTSIHPLFHHLCRGNYNTL